MLLLTDLLPSGNLTWLWKITILKTVGKILSIAITVYSLLEGISMYVPLPVGSIATETPENLVQSHKILQTPPKFTSQNPMRSHEQSPSNPAEIHTVIVHLVAEDSLKKETHVSRQLGPRMGKRGS